MRPCANGRYVDPTLVRPLLLATWWPGCHRFPLSPSLASDQGRVVSIASRTTVHVTHSCSREGCSHSFCALALGRYGASTIRSGVGDSSSPCFGFSSDPIVRPQRCTGPHTIVSTAGAAGPPLRANTRSQEGATSHLLGRSSHWLWCRVPGRLSWLQRNREWLERSPPRGTASYCSVAGGCRTRGAAPRPGGPPPPLPTVGNRRVGALSAPPAVACT